MAAKDWCGPRKPCVCSGNWTSPKRTDESFIFVPSCLVKNKGREFAKSIFLVAACLPIRHQKMLGSIWGVFCVLWHVSTGVWNARGQKVLSSLECLLVPNLPAMGVCFVLAWLLSHSLSVTHTESPWCTLRMANVALPLSLWLFSY